ncbi:3-isopropylmalate dehydratase small subunit [Paraburkholderia caledonica]|jgi:3-isopropylmalate/(R)-2-methylmalate dehydratase small subunit|uniref:3-isopropylmalate dehydratase small subunit n=1 Tax=Paraburkholderia caledonica TaxID=134536 RepID=UPI000483B79B|nr:3-isopropylmalate dehydratase small subunit [Paraburkholderia caledonica]
MTRLTIIQGSAAPLPIDNLDTDQIMPKQFLRIIDKAGLADGLLYDLRFDEQGAPRADCVLNRSAYANASILIGGANFGCGSSREHAVWGLQQYGFQAVIAPSFAEIFYFNAMNNRLLLVQLEPDAIDALTHQAIETPGISMSIDLEEQMVRSASGERYAYPIGARHKRMVIEGMDTVDLTLDSLAEIEAFERLHFARHPWAQVM